MTYVLYGALGMLAVVGLLAGGIALGWKARGVWMERAKQAVAEEVTEEERRKLVADQKAFDDMLNYNVEQAYGMNRTLEELAGGDS